MNRRRTANPAALLLSAFLVLAINSSASASGEPEQSFLYQNFVRASEVLDSAVAAHGGVELIDRALNIRYDFTGMYRLEGHFSRPWASKDYRMEGSTAYSAQLQAMKSEVKFYEEGQPIPSFSIVGPTNGLKLDGGRSRPDSIPEKELEKSRREELEILPQEYLRQARAGAASLRLLGSADGFDVLCYTLDSSESRALFFDASTHLLMRVERIGHWKHKGDRLEWRVFSDYFEQEGMQVPRHSEVHVEESSGQHNVISEITKIEFGGVLSADEFTIPGAYRSGFESWTLKESAVADTEGPLPSHDLGKGVYIIDLPSSDARSLLVGFSDFSVVVEAGDHSDISARLLATADHLLPDKPVRYVAMSHHHPLYANGIRPWVQRGVTVLSTPDNASYLRDLATRPYRIRPDAQQRQPREPKFEIIDGTRIIEDGVQRLEFHEFDYSTHVDEFVLTYLPSHKLIVTGDLVYILRNGTIGPANSRERAVHRVVGERGLAVESIMQTWFLKDADQLVPYSVLEEKVRLADAKDSKK